MGASIEFATYIDQYYMFSTDQGSIQIKDICIPFLKRTNKRIKRSRLLISPEEGLVVETPKDVSMRYAYKMIDKKKDWVFGTYQGIQKKRLSAQSIKKHEKSILVFGKEKFLEIKEFQIKDYLLETKSKIILGFKQSQPYNKKIETILYNWLKSKAEVYLPIRVKQLNNNRFSIKNIYVKDQKTLWGSCSEDHNLNLNWRLIMAPKFASDYIIFHELCHTVHLDHSPKYWSKVNDVYPAYKTAEKWFREFGFLLHLQKH